MAVEASLHSKVSRRGRSSSICTGGTLRAAAQVPFGADFSRSGLAGLRVCERPKAKAIPVRPVSLRALGHRSKSICRRGPYRKMRAESAPKQGA